MPKAVKARLNNGKNRSKLERLEEQNKKIIKNTLA
jgi:hypothetical protein